MGRVGAAGAKKAPGRTTAPTIVRSGTQGRRRAQFRTPLYGTSVGVERRQTVSERSVGRIGAGSSLAPGEEAVHPTSGRTSFRDGPHDEGLPTPGVTGDVHPGNVGREVGVPRDVTARVELEPELRDQPVLLVGTREAHRQRHQLGGDLPLGTRLLRQLAVHELDLDEVQPLDVAVLVALEVGGGDGVDPIATLLVRGGDLVEHRERRPGLARVPLLARLRHDLQLSDGGRALTVGGAHAVRARVAAADDDDVLALGGDRGRHVVALLHLVGERQVLHREVDAVQLAPGGRQVTGDGRAGRDDHGVVPLAQVRRLEVAADLDARTEAGALRAHLLDTPVDVPLLHLELGDAVAEEAADAVRALVDRDRVARPRELLRGGQARRARADDRDRLAGETLGDLRGDVPGVPRLVDDRDLDVLDGHGGLVDAEDARRLARGGAQPARELREVVRGVQALGGGLPVLAVRVVVPLGDEVPQRTAVVAERDTAVHAARGLRGDDRQQRARNVDLVPVLETHLHRTSPGDLASVVQKALGISHWSPPPSSSR